MKPAILRPYRPCKRIFCKAEDCELAPVGSSVSLKPINMLNSLRIKTAVALTMLASTFLACAQGTAFTYQGYLTASGAPANGFFDLQFAIYDAGTNGSMIGGPLTNAPIPVTNGLFTVQLDFGSNVFHGNPYWLQIGARTNGDVNPYVILAPLQQVTPIPYAIFAPNAGTAQTAASASSVSATNINGTMALTQLPVNILTNNATGIILNGTFAGNGNGLTNLNGNQITSGTVPDSVLSSNIVVIKGFQSQKTYVWTNAGVYTITIPSGVFQLTAKLWGAGGAGGNGGVGGGGAFVQQTIPVTNGQTYTVVVGQGGFVPGGGGGAGSGDAQGGSAANSPNGQGGQASSLFHQTATGNYIMLAVAGAGGGSGSGSNGGAGGNPGQGTDGATGGYNGIGGVSTDTQPGLPGGNYATNASTSGIASLASANGNGGNAVSSGGGGGGGYGGGGGGGFTPYYSHGGGGGGSYGDVIIGGNGPLPGNTGDSNYVTSCGSGGVNSVGYGGMAVVLLQQLQSAVTVPTVVAASGFSGDGSGLTNLNASQIASGTVPLAQLPSAVVTNTEAGVTLGGTFNGNFNGNGSGLTNLNASQIASGTIPPSQLPSAVVTNTETGVTLGGTFNGNGNGLINLNAQALNNVSYVSFATNVYSTAGVNNFTVPAGATRMVVKLWGASGGGFYYGTGGGGAFSMVTLNVNPGDTYTAVTGQGGGAAGSGGGNGSGDTTGSASYTVGGQASSLFRLTNGFYLMKAVAGGGGGGFESGTGGAGGNPGQNGSSQYPGGGGSNGNGGNGNYDGTAQSFSGDTYAAAAITTGVANLNQIDGDGGRANNDINEYGMGGGGGGGYGGGGGGFTGSGGSSAGGGGGSYGDTIIGGNYSVPGNTNDPNYVYPAGYGVEGGNNTSSNGNNGLLVVIFTTQQNTMSGNLTVSGTLNGSGSNLLLNGTVSIPGNLYAGQLISTGANAEVNFYDRGGVTNYGQWSYYALNGKAYFWNSIVGNRMSINTNGNVQAVGSFIANTTPDLAETIPAAANVEAGDIVCADPQHSESVVRCNPDSQGILGVISDGTSGFIINANGKSVDAPLTGKPLVLAGRVPVKISLENGPIKIGDYLTPSSIPGVAMRANGIGTVIGVALAPFDATHQEAWGQTGKVLCFVKIGDASSTSKFKQLEEQNQALTDRLQKLEKMMQSLEDRQSIPSTR